MVASTDSSKVTTCNQDIPYERFHIPATPLPIRLPATALGGERMALLPMWVTWMKLLAPESGLTTQCWLLYPSWGREGRWNNGFQIYFTPPDDQEGQGWDRMEPEAWNFIRGSQISSRVPSNQAFPRPRNSEQWFKHLTPAMGDLDGFPGFNNDPAGHVQVVSDMHQQMEDSLSLSRHVHVFVYLLTHITLPFNKF